MTPSATSLLESLRRSRVASYGIGLLAVGFGLANLVYFDTVAPVATMVFAVIVGAWLGGPRAGLLSMALSVPALAYYLPPAGWQVEIAQLPRLLYFIAICSFIVWIISAERRTSASLRNARDQLQRVIDSIPTMAWIVRPDGSLEFINRRWLDYAGITRDEALTQPTGTMHPDDTPAAIEKWTFARERGEPYESEMRLRAANGQYRWFLVRTVPIRDAVGNIVQWYGTSTDIEDRKRAEDAARDFGARLQLLSRRLIEVQEDERRHLARELHDEFAQVIATIKLHLHALKATCEPAARHRLDQSIAMLQTAGEQVRTLALELRPAMLETMGLDTTLRWLAHQNQSRTGIETKVLGYVDGVTGKVAIACFRVAQQALTNVAQHAGALHVWIELRQDEEHFEMVILDDGIGFDVVQTLMLSDSGAHLGLLGMRERIEILGGRLRIDSEPGLGTRIEVLLPVGRTLRQAAEDAA
jgi:PAS domain S-box-containing protein